MVWFISLIFRLITYYYYFPIFEYIYSTKIRNNTIEVPFFIPGARTERKSNLRVNPINESKIGFLLEFDWYCYYTTSTWK